MYDCGTRTPFPTRGIVQSGEFQAALVLPVEDMFLARLRLRSPEYNPQNVEPDRMMWKSDDAGVSNQSRIRCRDRFNCVFRSDQRKARRYGKEHTYIGMVLEEARVHLKQRPRYVVMNE